MSTTKMAASKGYRLPKRPLDKWSTRERLALASAVRISGNQNWVSVSRSVKPFGETNRPPDWFSQKNCASQYSDLLEKAETPKRKRGEKGEREVVETPAIQIVRKLTIERIEELKTLIKEEQLRYKKLKEETESIKSGQFDDKLDEIWESIQTEKRNAEEKRKEEERKLAEEAAERAKANALRKAQALQRTSSTASSLSEVGDSSQDSMPDQVNVENTDNDAAETAPIRPISIEIPSTQSQELNKDLPPTSPLLSSLLLSKQISVDSLQQIKAVAEAEHALKKTQASNQMETKVESTNQKTEQDKQGLSTPATPSIGSLLDATSFLQTKEETLDAGLMEVKHEVEVDNTEQVIEIEVGNIKEEIIESEHIVVEETVEVETHESPVKIQSAKGEQIIEIEGPIDTTLPASTTTIAQTTTAATPVTLSSSSSIAISGDEDALMKEEPPSPASSVSSRVSESGSKTSGKRTKGGRGSTSSRLSSSIRISKRPSGTDDGSSRPSDAETTDDDGDSSLLNMTGQGISALPESIPNSPLSLCSDTEDDKAYKTWKKSIMLVWRAAANHKYANVFLHPVTDDIAPGYSQVVKRPKNLTIIKRHVENGTIRTTTEFQRDMMLMFTNAIMYNSSNHDVFKMAEEMYNDVMEHIEQYVSTQIMVQNAESKMLRTSRRNENSDKEEDSRRRRTSSEAEGGKTKKRKIKADET